VTARSDGGARAAVTLQISLAPGDLRHAEHCLPHQLRVFTAQVDEVLCTLDAPPARAARAEPALRALDDLIDRCASRAPQLRAVRVDYGEAAVRAVGDTLFGGGRPPAYDHRGRPIYSYLFGVHAARCDYVFHLDSDMLFGGGGRRWIAEAVDAMRRRPDLLACNPLPGPPTSDGTLRSQRALHERIAASPPAYLFDTLSTRLFLIDRRRYAASLPRVRARVAPPRAALRALVGGRVPYDTLERILSRAMRDAGMKRLDFLGSDGGLWGVHPLERTERFYALLPALIRCVETGDVPDAQRGEYNVVPALLDHAEARA
jgi:hypothetical protein